MNTNIITASLIAALSCTTSIFAADTYKASLEAGGSYRQSGEHDKAIKEYSTAITQAANATERALATAKKAHVYTFSKQDYTEGRRQAMKALAIEDAKPVARVTALQVLATCQMKGDEDYESAIGTLEEALALDGVDWAKPSLLIALGDCQRFSKAYPEAVDSYRKITRSPNADNGIKAVAYLNMGITYHYNIRTFGKARDAYEMAVSLQPDLRNEVNDHLSNMEK